MIVTRLMGGLGNQMFQYAVACALSEVNQCGIFLDRTFLDQTNGSHTKRDYELDVFQINAAFADEKLIRKLQRNNQSWRRKLPFLFRNAVINERGSFFHPEVVLAKSPVYLNGFWQDERYFKHFAKIIRSEFSPVQQPSEINAQWLEKIKQSNCASLHIRRGDYVTNAAAAAFHGSPNFAYYGHAVNVLISEKKIEHVFIFSDDVAWVRENIKLPIPTTCIDHNQGRESYWDLMLMKSCKHHIIANSSFSWWGAWLNPSPDKLVIAPKNWFANADAGGREIVPENWTRL